MKDLVLAVDIGTSSVRAMLFAADGTILARSQVGYTTMRPAPYFEEQDPDLVRREVYRAIGICLTQDAELAKRVGAVGFSSQLYGIIALDGEDRPLTHNIIWSDGRAERQAEFMKSKFGENWLYPETGCPMNSIFPIAKLVWLRENRPDVFRAARRFVSIKEYVTFPLIGEWAVDHSMASATGMFDIKAHQWHSRALDYIDIRETQMSEPVSGVQGFTLVGDSPISAFGLDGQVRVFLGAGDGPLANIGSGAAALGTINIDLGTSGAARCITDTPTVDDHASLWCFCLTDDLWAHGGIVTNVGNAYQWLGAQMLGPVGADEATANKTLNRLATEVDAGAGNLLFLPYLRKARSPYWDGRLKGTIYGLTADHTVGHCARALLEAVAYDLRSITEIMRRSTALKSHVMLTGGLSKSPIMPQLLADVIDREIRTPDDCEGSIAGAAVLALKGLGRIDGLEFTGGPRAYRSYLPNAAKRERYVESFNRYAKLVRALRDVDF